MPLIRSVLLALALVAPTPGFSADKHLTGKVVSVSDGDTLVMLEQSGRKIKIRLSGIDAPEVRHNRNESDQPWGQQAKETLASVTQGRQIEAKCNGQSYDREVCEIFIGGQSINAWMVANGHAWAYDRPGQFQRLENQARAKRIGIWSLPERQQIEPKYWRKMH